MNQLFFSNGYELFIRDLSLNTLIIGVALLAGLILYLLHHKYAFRASMLLAFAGISTTVFAVLAIGAVSLQLQADSSGKMHRQIGLEFWVCDTEISPRYTDSGLVKQTTSQGFTLDEYKQAYRSGFVLDAASDATLGQLMQNIGGDLQSDYITIPLSSDNEQWLIHSSRQDGDPQGDMTVGFLEQHFLRHDSNRLPVAQLSSGQRCHSSGDAELQVFVYRLNDDNTYYQEKLDRPDDYILPEASSVPPGDCVIIEYTAPKERTSKLCQSYGVRDSKRCSQFGAESVDTNICHLREVHPSGEPL